jgi:MoxR-like ATPase
LFRVNVGYPERDQEVAMLELHSRPAIKPAPVATADEILAIRAALDTVYATRELQEYVVDLVRQSRRHADLALGASPRAAISLLKAARAQALLQGRGFMTHADVQEVCLPVLSHRLILRPEAELDGRRIEAVIQQVIRSVPVVQDRLR